MASSTHWQPLRHEQSDLPKLFYLFVSSRSEHYALTVTDLTNVWEEDLDASALIARAEREACAINPGRDADQLRILLDKIHDTLANHESDTIVTVRGIEDDLIIDLSAPLPEPLPRFSWSTRLTRAPHSQITEVVLAPLLHFAYQQQQQLEALLVQLRHKDHVISKILDKMESSNTQLGDVFPARGVRISSRRSQREQYANIVPGLAPFEPSSVLHSNDRGDVSESAYQMLSSMHPGLGLPSPLPDQAWWTKLNRKRASITSPVARTVESGPATPEDDEDETDEDDFEVIHKPNTGSMYTLAPDAGDTTDDEDIRSSPPPVPQQRIQRTKEPSSLSQLPGSRPSTQNRRLGTIGGSQAHNMPSSSQVSTKARRLGVIGDSQARDSSPPLDAHSATSSPPLVDADRERFAGRRNSRLTPPPTEASSSATTTPTKISPAKRRLGAIGGDGGSSQSSHQPSSLRFSSLPPRDEREEDASDDRSRTVRRSDREQRMPSPSSSIPDTRSRIVREQVDTQGSKTRETSQDRANRKREEMKQSLESRAKAPAKKKRKF